MNRLAKIITSASKEDLLLIQKDLAAGNVHKLLQAQLQQHAEKEMKSCPTCGREVDPFTSIKIEFGPAELRMKAHFDAVDCLIHFTQHQVGKKEEDARIE